MADVAHPDQRIFPTAVATSVVLHLCLLGALIHGVPHDGRTLPEAASGHLLAISLPGLPREAPSYPATAVGAYQASRPPTSMPAHQRETEAASRHATNPSAITGAPGLPAAAGRSADAGGGETAPTSIEDYRDQLLTHLARFRFYPNDARRAGREGIVRVRFEMTRKGAIVSAEVDTSSGDAALDAAAVATIFRAQPLPPIPAGLPDDLAVLMPIAFSLPKTALAVAPHVPHG